MYKILFVIIISLMLGGCSAKGVLIYDDQGRLESFEVDRNVSVKDGETEIDSKMESPLKDLINVGAKLG